MVAGYSFFMIVLACNIFGSLRAYPMEDLIRKLPRQPKVGFRQFGGYVDVDKRNGRRLFYYFVEAEEDADKKPLTLWLNGGPGCSSIGGGAFTEMGPFKPRGDGRGLRRNSKSWNRVSNLLFVESPAGVGWSYSNTSSDYKTGDRKTATDMLIFLLEWFKKFSHFRSRDFFLSGESYAGHYIPQLAVLLLDHNAQSSGFKFNIKGIAIGNPLLNPDRDIPAVYNFLWSHGMISDEIHLTLKTQCDFDDYSFESGHNESKSCDAMMNWAYEIVGDYVDLYDVMLDVCLPSMVQQEQRLRKRASKISIGVDVCIDYETMTYLNLPEVQKALHANTTRLPGPWTDCSEIIKYQLSDMDKNIVPTLKKTLQNRVPLWVYSGDQDSVVPMMGSRTIVRELARDLNFNITVPYRPWYHENQVGGWVTEYGNLLTFATVRGASHMVPYAQPSRALQLFRSFIKGKIAEE